MKKFFVFALAISALVACQKEAPLSQPAATKLQSNRSSHTVPIEKALRELDQFLSGGQTRGADPRHVTNVQTVSGAQLFPTRTRAEELPDLDDVFYIAHFEEGEGCAILAADDRLASVQAVLDRSDYTAEQLAEIASMTPEQATAAEATPLHMLIHAAQESFKPETAQTRASQIVGGREGEWEYDHSAYTVTGYLCAAGQTFPPKPFLPMSMRWRQNDPFNAKGEVPPGTKKPYLSGAGAVALAQLLAANQMKPATIGGVKIDWDKVGNAMLDSTKICRIGAGRGAKLSPEADAVATLIEAVRRRIHSWYRDNRSIADMYEMAKLLNENGGNPYKDVQVHDYLPYGLSFDPYPDGGYGREMLKRRRLATIVSNSKYFHYWVIDAWFQQVGTKIDFDRYGNQLSQSESFTRDVYHCNFGWGGAADGFYPADFMKRFPQDNNRVSPIFDTTEGPINWYEEENQYESSCDDARVMIANGILSYHF